VSGQYYNSASPRLGAVRGKLLKAAVAVEVLGITGDNHDLERNQSDTVIFRRWLPRGASVGTAASINRWDADPEDHRTQEGVTPTADQIAPQDITVTLQQYSCLYMYTDKVAELYEDKIPEPMKRQAGQRMGLVREMIRYGALKGCSNRFYCGGSSRSTVSAKIDLPTLRAVTRSILGNRGQLVTQILAPSPNFNTASVEAAMLVFCHTDCENDIRELPGFKEVAAYGQRKPIHPMELGSTDRYRFIVSPELSAYANAGAAVSGTPPTMISTGGSNNDVYPYIVVAEDAWGDVALRGMRSFDPVHIPHTQKDKSDPIGQRGYIGAKFWSAAFVQNDGWMAVVEAGATNL